MAFTGNNQTIYNAAFDGAFAALASSALDPTATDYATIGAVATAFATQVDSQVATDANLSTGAGGTTVDPVAGVTTASLNALGHLAALCAFEAFRGKGANLATLGQTPATYATQALAIKAMVTAARTQYAAAPGGTSLT